MASALPRIHPHFERAGDAPEPSWPDRLYAKIDHTEPARLDDTPEALFAFDTVDANDFDRFPPFTSNVAAVEAYRRDYWQWRSARSHRPPNGDMFDQLRLYRVEAMLARDDPVFKRWASQLQEAARVSDEDSVWIEIEVLHGEEAPVPGSIPAEVYPSLFAAPAARFIRLRQMPPASAKLLAAAFSLKDLPRLGDADVRARLGGCEALALGVYDVGQGSATALLADDLRPTMYFDLGCGVYRNARTCPDPLAFCFTNAPPVVLSHWDADHWAGAYWLKTGPNRGLQGLQLDWIAPDQSVGPVHLAFARDVWMAGGRLFIYPLPAGQHLRVTLSPLHELFLLRSYGAERNDDGFVLQVVEQSQHCWLLTGDARYDAFRPALPMPAVEFEAVVVPHHGADLGPQAWLPPPSPPPSRRLLFSFGPNNAHGRRSTSHPKAECVAAHQAAGWDVDRWDHVAAPGHRVARGDVRATAKNGPGCERIGSIVVRWNGHPAQPRPAMPCGRTNCTIDLTQT